MVAAGARIGGREALSWGALPRPLFSLRDGLELGENFGDVARARPSRALIGQAGLWRGREGWAGCGQRYSSASLLHRAGSGMWVWSADGRGEPPDGGPEAGKGPGLGDT